MKKVVTGEAEDSLHRLDTIEYKATDLESIRLRNEIEIENLRGEVEEMEAKMHIAEERSRSVTIEVRMVCCLHFLLSLEKLKQKEILF